MRWVGSRLVIRLQHQISDAALSRLTKDFADIITSGVVERVAVTESERDDDDVVHLPRIAFRYNRRGYARLRTMVDAINSSDA